MRRCRSTVRAQITRIHGDSDGEVLLYFQLKNFLSDKPGTVQLLNPPLFLDMYENPSPLLQDLLLKCVAFLAVRLLPSPDVCGDG